LDESDEIVKKECDENDQDQIWYFNIWDDSIVFEEETPVVTAPENVYIYFYNAYKNKCITSDGSSVTVGNCFNNDDAIWEIPVSHDGYYRPKDHSDKCLTIIDGVVSLSECNENTTLYRDGNFIRSPTSADYCIASSQSDNTLEYLQGCSDWNSDHIWYFNVWTPPETTSQVATPTETVVESTEVAVPTETVVESTEVAVPTETVVESTEVAVPTETVVESTEVAVPTETVVESTEVAVPTETVVESTEVAVPTETVVESTEVAVPTETVVESIEVAVPTETVVESTEVAVPTEAIVESTEVVESTSVTEENPTMTITTTVTAILTEA